MYKNNQEIVHGHTFHLTNDFEFAKNSVFLKKVVFISFSIVYTVL